MEDDQKRRKEDKMLSCMIAALFAYSFGFLAGRDYQKNKDGK